jgi:hypothetical protein
MIKRKFARDSRDEVFDFIVENGIATEDEVRLVTSINGYNGKSLSDIIYVRTGYHNIEQLHDCEPDSYDFTMVDFGEEEEEEEDFSCGGKKQFANDSINKEELITSAKTAAKYNDAEEEFKHFKKAVENSKATSLYDLYIELKDVSDKMVEKNYNLYDFQDLGFMPKNLTDAAWEALGTEFLFETGRAENEKDALTKIDTMAPSPEFERWCKRNHIVLH